MYIRAIHGHSGGDMIVPELIGTLKFRTSGKNSYSREAVLSTSSLSLKQVPLQVEERKRESNE